MLLRHLYDLGHSPSHRILDDLAFVPKPVRWIVELSEEGHLVSFDPRATGDEKRGKEFYCPQTTRNKNMGAVAEFLVDSLTGIFGLDPDLNAALPAKRRAERDTNNARKHTDYGDRGISRGKRWSLQQRRRRSAGYDVSEHSMGLRHNVQSNRSHAEKIANGSRTKFWCGFRDQASVPASLTASN